MHVHVTVIAEACKPSHAYAWMPASYVQACRRLGDDALVGQLEPERPEAQLGEHELAKVVQEPGGILVQEVCVHGGGLRRTHHE